MNENQHNNSPQPPVVAGGGNPRGHGMAVTSMIMGILSLVLWCICIGYIIFAPLAIIFAVVAKKQGSTSGMATAGLVTGIVSAVGGILYWVVYVLIIGAAVAPWMDFMDMAW
jgi:tetrahydromethanopterin S-methyltransferase subunit B